MKNGTVLVIGNSGVGKSTLINSVLGEHAAATGYGIEGTTKSLKIYEDDDIPFRVVDTAGFEPSWLKSRSAISAVKKWSKESSKKGKEDTQINVIWICVDGTSSKLFPETINDISKAISIWSSVPIIVVITKSYSVPERENNIEMVRKAFNTNKRSLNNLKKILPVVATPYIINDNSYAAPDGISELIETTNELMPEGIKAANNDISRFILNRKRALAHSTVGVATAAAVVVGAVPIPFSDATILVPVEIAEVNALARIYGVDKDEGANGALKRIVDVGTVGLTAKTAIQLLKAIPGVNLGASVINAVIAGSIVATIGEGSIYVFEQVYLGNKSVEDIDWIAKVVEEKLNKKFIEIATNALKMVTNKSDVRSIGNIISSLFTLASKND